MAFLTTTSILTDQFIGALCNTLVHSLWQGVLLAAVTGLLIILTRKASAVLRYNLLIAALVIFAVGVGATFIIQFNRANVVASNTSASVSQVNNFAPVVINNFNTPITTATFSDRLYSYLNNNHNTIVLIWFLIICAKSIQLAVGLWGVRRLKTRQVSTVSIFWDARIRQLANNLQIKQAISLLESGLAKAPMVIGHLKPVILMPIGLLTALTTAQIEAILVHELAHIKRRDYLVNLLQSLMEIAFFFNPAVLWVSQLIKAERENCCDDLALQQSSDKSSYVRALLSCEEYQQAVPAYAMGFPGGKGSLFDRVKRIAGNRNHSLNLFEKTALAVCLVVSGLCMSAFAEQENIKHTMHEVAKAIQHIKADITHPGQVESPFPTKPVVQQNHPVLTAEKPILQDVMAIQKPDTDNMVNQTLKLTKQGYQLKLDSMKVHLKPINTRLGQLHATPDYLDTTKRYNSVNATTRMTRQSAMVNEMLKDGLIKSRSGLSYKINEDVFIINGVQQPDETRKKYFEMTINPNVDYKYKNGDVRKAVDPKVNVNTNVKTNVNATINTNVDYNVHFDTLRNSSSMSYQGKNGERSTYKVNTMLYKPSRVTYSTNVYTPDSTNHLNSGAKLSPLNLKLHIPNMADALYNAGLIKDKTHFTALITNDELVVNGVKQSEENHQRILKLYQKKPDDKVNFSFTYPGK